MIRWATMSMDWLKKLARTHVAVRADGGRTARMSEPWYDRSMRPALAAIALSFLVLSCSDAPPAPDLHFRSAGEIAAAIRQGSVLPSEMLEIYLDRVQRLNPQLNAVVALDVDGARERAAEADRALAAGEIWGPLHGLPITIKDSFGVVGLPTTVGLPEYANFRADENAPAVQRLVDAGAIVFGMTNVPVMLSDWQSFNAVYGTTNNPWDLTRTPGGSSGGAAAALAAGLTSFELGSDIFGSLRIPAHFSGVYSHKPTFGLVPRSGQFPMFRPAPRPRDTISVAGPMARSVDDLEMLLEVLTQPTTEQGRTDALPPARGADLHDYRIAVWVDDPGIEMADEARAVIDEALARLADAGVELDYAARPELALRRSFEVNLTLVIDLSTGPPAPDEVFAVLDEMRGAWDDFFRTFDVVLAPVSHTAAFRHVQSEPLPLRPLPLNGRNTAYSLIPAWTSLATVGGLPSTVIPIGRTDSGLPVGLQVIGPSLEDRTSLDVARHIDAVLGEFRHPPGF